MQLEQITIDRLSVSKANMRHGRKAPDISDILPSVKARGILVPLLVRPNGEVGHYEIVAGRRRYHAALAATGEGGSDMSLPCAIMDEGDDAAALEASLIENIIRQDPDEVTKWETFTRLIKKGRCIEDIAATFGIGAAMVKRILALGNLLPRIREAYRAESIDASTIRHLTLASKAQQKAWLQLFESEDGYAPTGQQLKAWLFGGAAIPVASALFDIASYEGKIVTDLFEENGYFGDADQFWAAQSAAIAEYETRYLEQGWSSVEIIPPERYFHSWEYEHVSKRKGGRVYIDVNPRGEVSFHEGYLSRSELRKRAAAEAHGDAPPKPLRPETTAATREYIDLHRHAAVRARVCGDAPLALRLAVAHMICGSPLWTVRTAHNRSRNEAVTASIANSVAEQTIAGRRAKLLDLLGFAADEDAIVGGQDLWAGIDSVLARLIALGDTEVGEILAMAMAETLASATPLVDYLGEHLAIDMADYWSADSAFFGLIRDRQILTALLAEIGGESLASVHANEKGHVLKSLMLDCLSGENGRPKHERWVPRWMTFPPSAYIERGRGEDGEQPVTAATEQMEEESDDQMQGGAETSLAA